MSRLVNLAISILVIVPCDSAGGSSSTKKRFFIASEAVPRERDAGCAAALKQERLVFAVANLHEAAAHCNAPARSRAQCENALSPRRAVLPPRSHPPVFW